MQRTIYSGITSNTSDVVGNLFILDFITHGCNFVNDSRCENDFTPPRSTILVSFRRQPNATEADTAAFKPSHGPTDQLGVVDNSCTINAANELVVPPSNTGRSCRVYYYCSGFPGLNGAQVPLEVRVVTSSGEKPTGVWFDVKLTERLVTIRPLALNNTLTAVEWFRSVTNSSYNQALYQNGAQGFVLHEGFDHFYVDIAPFGSSPGIFWAYASKDDVLSFSVRNVVQRFSATSTQTTFSAASWEISLNLGDIASGTFITNNGWTLNAYRPFLNVANTGCRIATCFNPTTLANNVECRTNGNIASNADIVSLLLDGCTITQGRYYIAVRLPGSATFWDYRVSVFFVAKTNKVLPTTWLRTVDANGKIYTGVIGDNALVTATRPSFDNYYMLNYGTFGIPSNSSILNPYYVITLFGINHGTAVMEVTKGKEWRLGNNGWCGDATPFRLVCNTYQPGSLDKVPVVRDYCKLVIRNCKFQCNDYCPARLSPPATCTNTPVFHGASYATSARNLQFGFAEDYFVTVYANPLLITPQAQPGWENGQKAIDYALRFDVRDDSPMVIASAASAAGSTWYRDTTNNITRYTHITSVDEQLYNHYTHTFTSAIANNPETFFLLEVYTDHEDEEVVVYWTNNNNGQLAGSSVRDATTSNRQTDNCYEFKGSCTTRGKGENELDPTAANTRNNLCRFYWQFCDLQANVPYYFSVYGLHSSEKYGYARPVRYTAQWTIRQAQPIFDRVTTSEYVFRPDIAGLVYAPAQAAPYRTWQYRLDIPTGVLYDYVRVRLADPESPEGVTKGSTVVGYIQCAVPAGNCPCYTSFGTGSISDVADLTQTYVDLVADACLCPSNKYYVTVVSGTSGYHNRPIVYTMTPYIQAVTLTSEITLSVGYTTPNITTGSLRVLDNGEHEDKLYVIRYRDTSPDDSLVVTIKYVHGLGKKPGGRGDPKENVQLYLHRNSVPQKTRVGETQTCGVKCVATESRLTTSPDYELPVGNDWFSYCTIVIQPCEFIPGDYVLRVWGDPVPTAPSTVAGDTSVINELIDYTLYTQIVNKAPVALTNAVPRRTASRRASTTSTRTTLRRSPPWATSRPSSTSSVTSTTTCTSSGTRPR